MSKELYMAAHEALIDEYLEETGSDDWSAAYEATADQAFERMQDQLADRADAIRKYGRDA